MIVVDRDGASNIQDGAICDNSKRLVAINYYYKELHLGCCSSPRYASVTNVIIRILVCRFVHPGGRQLTILSFLNTGWKVRITRLAKPNKLLINFLFDYNNVRAFEVFKWRAGCIFKSETTKIKLGKNIKDWFLS